MTLTQFNVLGKEEAAKLLQSCCVAAHWVRQLSQKIPFENEMDLIRNAEHIWYNECHEADWLEAFTHHPKIGDAKGLAEKFASTKHLASAEQATVIGASEEIIELLAQLNKDYEAKFGFIFIVCATGKSAKEMLRLLQDRLSNTYSEELNIAMGEQHKITILRLQKLIESENWMALTASQLTTHVLDTSIGKPGKNITIRLQKKSETTWQTFAQGVTNSDGRLADLLPQKRILAAGNYKIVFDTGKYFLDNNFKGFYPEVEIQFSIFDNSHYHVPLLINPFGYSTYRGS